MKIKWEGVGGIGQSTFSSRYKVCVSGVKTPALGPQWKDSKEVEKRVSWYQ